MVSALPTILAAALAAYHELTPTKLRTIWTGSSARREGAARRGRVDGVRTLELYADHQPYAARHQILDEEAVLDFNDCLAWRQFSNSKGYQDFYRTMGFRYQVMCGLPAAMSHVAGIVLSRNEGRFTACDRSLLKIIRPYLIQAYLNAKAVSDLHQEQALAKRVVRTLGLEMMVLGRNAQVRSAGERAWRWVAEYFEDAVPVTHRLPPALEQWILEQQKLCHEDGQARASDETIGEFHTAGPIGKRLMVRLSGEADELLLLLHEEQHSSDDDGVSADFQKKFGITPREAEVLRCLSWGKTNAEIGAILKISHRTVGKHLEHMFPRLGVETRTGAIARALSSAAAS